jgi:hypothetical protein
MLLSLHDLSLNLKGLPNPRDLNPRDLNHRDLNHRDLNLRDLNLKFPILFKDRELLLTYTIFNKQFFEQWDQIESARIIHNTNLYIYNS